MIYYTRFNFKKLNIKKIKYKKEWFDDNIYCFDIETSSAYLTKEGELYIPIEGQKKHSTETAVALCWIWQASVAGETIYGRTLEEFRSFIILLHRHLGVKPIVYVHNLSFEFVFLCNIFEWEKVFARSPHRIIYCECKYAQFRCSYMLTRLSLEMWGVQTGKRKKLVGDLDYNKLRTPYTRVTPKELGYCENDVLVMNDGLEVYKRRYKHVANIPLTQTGEVRKKVKEMFAGDTRHLFTMTRLLPEDSEMYRRFKACVWGGLTHANVFHTDRIYKNVHSYDITSSYPYVMCARKYPVAPPIKMRTDQWEKYCCDDNYCAFALVKFTGLETKLHNNYLSGYKYVDKENLKLDNGRIITAESITLWITDVDLLETLDSYNYESMEVVELYICKADYLPKKLVEYILQLFENKTTLDGIEGQEDLYQQSKQFINSLFGMSLTDLVQDDVVFHQKTGEWEVVHKNIDTLLDKKRKEWWSNFNAYIQGIWVVAYARQNLWEGIKEIDRDVIYYDTDSIKFIGDHEQWFIDYNKRSYSMLENVLLHYGINPSKGRAVSPKGKVKTLGEFKYEGTYLEFKTLGAKRYGYRDEDGYHLTIAGVNKHYGAGAIRDLNDFKNNMVFDYQYCRRLTLHYNTDMPEVVWNKGKYDEFTSNYKHGVCGANGKYVLSNMQDLKEVMQIAIRGLV